jgi:hypothetical protein
MLPYHIPVCSPGNLEPVHPPTCIWLIYPQFLTFYHPASSFQFPWCTICTYQSLDIVYQVLEESYAVECIDWSCMIVVIQSCSYYAVSATSIIHMTSLTSMFIANLVTYLEWAVLLNPNRQDNIKFIGGLTAWFEVKYFHMAQISLAHAPMNYYASQCAHWNQEWPDIQENRYRNNVFIKYNINNSYLPVYSSGNTSVVTIVCPNRISIWCFAQKETFRGNNFQV